MLRTKTGGMAILSMNLQTGGAGNVVPVTTEEDLRKVLLEFGLTVEYSNDVIERLKNPQPATTGSS
jgi:hypothetical protein